MDQVAAAALLHVGDIKPGAPSLVDPTQGTIPGGDSLFGPLYRDQVAAETPDHIPLSVLKRMRRDGQIRLGLETIKAIIGKPDRFFVDGDDAAARMLVDRAVRPVLADLLRLCMNAIDFGFQAAEILWDYVEVNVSPREDAPQMQRVIAPVGFRDIDPERVALLKNPDGTYAGLSIGGGGGAVSADRLLSPACSVLATHGKEFGNLYGESTLAAAYVHYQYSAIYRKLWGRFLERFALGTMVGRAPHGRRVTASGQTVDPVVWLGTVMANSRGGGVITIPSERDAAGHEMWGVELMETSSEGKAFSDAVQFEEAMKLRSILVPERVLTQDVLTGSHSMAESHAETFSSVLDGLVGEVLLGPLNDQVLRVFLSLNGITSPVRYCATPISREARAVYADLLRSAINAPVRLADGRSYSVNSLLDHTALLEQLAVPHRTVDEAATEPLPVSLFQPGPDEDEDDVV